MFHYNYVHIYPIYIYETKLRYS